MPIVKYNAIVNSDAARTWGVLKRFGEISQWHPSIAQSFIEDGQADGLVGCVRCLTLQDGTVLRERLLMVDESQLSFSYRFEEAPLPVDNYVLTVKLIPLNEQASTVIQWTAQFETRELDPQGQQTEIIRSLVIGGHESLQAYLSRSHAI